MFWLLPAALYDWSTAYLATQASNILVGVASYVAPGHCHMLARLLPENGCRLGAISRTSLYNVHLDYVGLSIVGVIGVTDGKV